MSELKKASVPSSSSVGGGRLLHREQMTSEPKGALNPRAEGMRPAWLRDGIVTLLLFLLLLQWLRPLPALAEMDARVLVEPAALVLAGILLLDYLRFPGWLGWPLKMAFCLAWVGYMFSRHTMPDSQWFETYARTLLLDGSFAWGRHWTEVSAETRLLMFVLGWALMISVIHSLMLLRQHGLWFVLATLGYLVGLQLATDIETLREMAYAAAIGLGLLLLLNLPRVERKFAVARKSPGWPFRWLALGSVLIAVCVASGWWGSSAARGEVQPVDWSALARWSDRYADKLAKSVNAQGDAAGAAFAMSGYGTDDSRLGTPLFADDGVAFTAQASRLVYWRGESKSYYDGHGWLTGEKGSVSAVSAATAAAVAGAGARADVGAGSGASAGASAAVGGGSGASSDAGAGVGAHFGTSAGTSTGVSTDAGGGSDGDGIGGALTSAASPGDSFIPLSEAKSDSAVGQGAAEGADERSVNGWPLVQEVMLSSHATPGGMLFVGGPIERLDVLLGRSGTMIPASRLTVEQATGKYQVAEWQNPVQYYRAVVDLRSQARLLGMSGWEDAGSDSAGGVAAGSGGGTAAAVAGMVAGEDGTVAAETGTAAEAEGTGAAGAGKAGAVVAGVSLSEAERTANLQLPEELPGRVSDLAHRVAGAGKSPYEQAALLESYLKTHYAYSLSGSQVPAAGKDFVDDFLFRQMAGYCDHFSSAMVVMLRTLGIPARWVKGYAPGEVSVAAGDESAAMAGGDSGKSSAVDSAQTADGPMSEGKLLHITVRNRDAHSWAEAWIEGVGWVAFEPTPGFAPTVSSGTTAAVAQPATAERGAALAQRLPAGAQALARAAGSAVAAATAAAEAAAGAAVASAVVWRWDAAAALALALLLAWAAWRWRDELALQWALRGYRRPGGRWRSAIATAAADGGCVSDGAYALSSEEAQRTGLVMLRWSASAVREDDSDDSRDAVGASGGDPASRPLGANAYRLAPPAAGRAAHASAARASAAPLLRVCERLWPRLRRRLGGQPPQLTLREFAAAQQALAPSQRQALVAFAQLYEAVRYGNELGRRVSRRELSAMWRQIVKSGLEADS